MIKYTSKRFINLIGLTALVLLLCKSFLFMSAQSLDNTRNDSVIAHKEINQTFLSTLSPENTDHIDQPRESLLMSKDEFVDFTEAPTLLFDNTDTNTSDEFAPSNKNTTSTESSSLSSPNNGTIPSSISIGLMLNTSQQNNNASTTTSTTKIVHNSGSVDNTTEMGLQLDRKIVTTSTEESSTTEELSDDNNNEEDETNNSNDDSSDSEDTKDNTKPFEPPKNISQYMDYVETLFHDLRHQITDLFEPHIPQLIRTSQKVQLSSSCSYDMLRLALALRQFEPWALRLIDSSGKVPEGIFEGSFTALGSYDECLSTVFASSSISSTMSNQPSTSTNPSTVSSNENLFTQGKYCLVAVSPFMPPKPPADRIEHLFQEEASKRNQTKDDQFSRISPMFYYMKFRIGVCIPSTCDDADMNSISTALSTNLRLNITIPDCRTKQELPLTRQQLIGGLTFAIVFISVIFATLVDYCYRTRRRNNNKSPCAENSLDAVAPHHSKHNKITGTSCHLNSGFRFDDDRCDIGTTRISSNNSTLTMNGSSNQIIDLNEKCKFKYSRDSSTSGILRTFSMLVNFRLYFGNSLMPKDEDFYISIDTPTSHLNSYKQDKFHSPIHRSTMIDCLNGIRVLSLCWVIIANSYITLDPRATKRLVITREASKDFFFQVIMQASLAIETFFFLSGILMSLSFNRKLRETISTGKRRRKTSGDQKDNSSNCDTTNDCLSPNSRFNTWIRWIHFYVHRYIRMTPATMLVIAISMFAYRYGDGPLWYEATQKAHQSCAQNWWRHLLHVANFIDTRQMCFIHYWYIAADMQLFLLAPILMFLLYRFRRIGYIIIALIGTTSAGFVFYTTYTRNLPPTLLFYNSDPESRREFGNTIMTKPLTHALPYLVGILVGERLSKQNSEATSPAKNNHFIKTHNRATLTTLFGSTVTVIALVELFLPYKWNNSHLPTRFLAALYASVFRFAWSLVLAFIVISCRHKRTRKCKQIQITNASNQFNKLATSTIQSNDCYETLCRGCKTNNINMSNNKWFNEAQRYFIRDGNLRPTLTNESNECYCGSSGNIINRFLSLGIFNQLSKLSFVAYLIHLPLMSMFIGQTRGVFAFSHTLVIHLALSYLMMTFILSFVLVHIIEFPFITFERYLFNTLLLYAEHRDNQSKDWPKNQNSTKSLQQNMFSNSYVPQVVGIGLNNIVISGNNPDGLDLASKNRRPVTTTIAS